ncbi:MAG: pyridoxamine 5'-phosphate oxidase family protein [Gaiellaceae bacterium]
MSVDDLLAVQRSSYAGATPGFRDALWPEAEALGRDELATLLDRHRYCVLATARADGRAHAAPVAFVVHDGAFWFATFVGLRLRNLRARPWASLVVMEGDADVGEVGDPHIALTAEGPVKLHAIDDWRLFEAEWLRRHTDPPTWAAALAELRPERLFTHAAR